jgi:hypothetical protein
MACLFGIYISQGQLSPGELSSAHAEFEGLANCTQCHELGEKVTDKKCLECHTEIQSLVNQKSGYHGQPEVIRKDCAECHSDHHGRKFDMVRFDEDNFDHLLTGYELEGEHAKIECRECHLPDFIADRDLKKRKDTYLGLQEECLSCHEDFHQETLSNDCLQCHNMEGFRPAPGFDHNEADFVLKGAHQEVDCKECHAETTRNGVAFQEFTGLDFEDCVSCHEDPHSGRFPGTCAACHNEKAFEDNSTLSGFRHGLTGFNLNGKHRDISCFTCHADSGKPTTLFGDLAATPENECVSCHEDQHNGLYGTDCAQCHKESSFLSLKDMDFFDHSVTDYPLEGKHVGIDCKECHTERFSTPIDFSECQNCHEDYHLGQFSENGVTPDCVTCHSLDEGFDYSLYTLEQHQETVFPLEGAHLATPCFACHLDEEEDQWNFRSIGQVCVDCHDDLHEGYIPASYYPEDDCTKCHGSETWDAVTFDHNQTDWNLEGKHQTVACSACHFEENPDMAGEILQQFVDLPSDCVSCHENVHGDDFAENGVTDCTRCHTAERWFPDRFNHDATNFPLEGAHAQVDCAACHDVVDSGGETETIYKLGKFQCIDCHLQ